MDSPSEEKHSRFGIASFVISVAVGVLLMGVLIVAGFLHNLHPTGPYPGQMVVGLLTIGLLFADLAAMGLGIAAVSEEGRKKVFGVLGLAFSGLTILATVALIVLGLRLAGRL